MMFDSAIANGEPAYAKAAAVEVGNGGLSISQTTVVSYDLIRRFLNHHPYQLINGSAYQPFWYTLT